MEGRVEAPSPCKEYQPTVPIVPVPWSEQERPNDQEGKVLEGIETGHNATLKAALSSQVVCKPDDSQMTYQLSRPRLGSKRASQSCSFPQNRIPTDKDGHVDCRGGLKGLGHIAHGK
jgi:hypothetical protein